MIIRFTLKLADSSKLAFKLNFKDFKECLFDIFFFHNRMLLDVNNVFVNAANHGFEAGDYVDAIPAERIAYVHLAGHADHGEFLLDDHGSAVPDGVLDLARLPALAE